MGTRFSGTYLFGDDASFQLTSTSFMVFKLLKTEKIGLKFRPQLSIIAGLQTIELVQTSPRPGGPVTTYVENDMFDLINTQLNLPLQFNKIMVLLILNSATI